MLRNLQGETMKPKFIILLAISALLLTGCFSSWQGDTGTFTVNFGSASNNRSASYINYWTYWLYNHEIIDNLEYTVKLTNGPGPNQIREKINTLDETQAFSVAPGRWTITIEADYETEIDGYIFQFIAYGSRTLNINPGANGEIKIPMGPKYHTVTIYILDNKNPFILKVPHGESLYYIHEYDMEKWFILEPFVSDNSDFKWQQKPAKSNNWISWNFENGIITENTTLRLELENMEAISSWEALAAAIENAPEEWHTVIQISGTLIANEPIYIENKYITLTAKENQDTLITRYNNFYSTFFYLGGDYASTMFLGLPGMKGRITLDGNLIPQAESLIYTSNFSTLNIYEGVTLTKNIATNGGAVNINNGSFYMYGGDITENTANNGGGLYVGNGGFFSMYGGVITENTANNNGGGIYIDRLCNFSMSGGIIDNNTSYSDGGGVYLAINSNFNMENGKISLNKASNGGGVYVTGNHFDLYDGSISGNEAENNGGGIYVANGHFNMYDGNISRNTAKEDGGGVYVGTSGYLNKTQGIIFGSNGGLSSNNAASQSGHAAFVSWIGTTDETTRPEQKINSTLGPGDSYNSEP